MDIITNISVNDGIAEIQYSTGQLERTTEPDRIREAMDAYCEQMIEGVSPPIISATMYYHSSKDQNYCLASEVGLSDAVADRFAYVGYEISVGVQIDRKTGVTRATSLNGMPLMEPVAI